MRSFIAALALCAVLLQGLALAQAAAAEQTPYMESQQQQTIAVLKDGRLEQIYPADLQPVTQYVVNLRCLRGDTLVLESGVGVVAGFQAELRNVANTANSSRVGSVITIEQACGGDERAVWMSEEMAAQLKAQPAAGKRGGMPMYYEPPLPAAVLAAAQQFTLCGLRISVYCPGADRFEVEVTRSDTPAPELVQYPGELVPEYVAYPASDYYYVGRLSAALDTPDAGFAEPPS